MTLDLINGELLLFGDQPLVCFAFYLLCFHFKEVVEEEAEESEDESFGSDEDEDDEDLEDKEPKSVEELKVRASRRWPR